VEDNDCVEEDKIYSEAWLVECGFSLIWFGILIYKFGNFGWLDAFMCSGVSVCLAEEMVDGGDK
jgi:hypothetical protein